MCRLARQRQSDRNVTTKIHALPGFIIGLNTTKLIEGNVWAQFTQYVSVG